MEEQRIRVVAAMLSLAGLALILMPGLPKEWGTVALLVGLFGPRVYAHWARQQRQIRQQRSHAGLDTEQQGPDLRHRFLKVLRGGQAEDRGSPGDAHARPRPAGRRDARNQAPSRAHAESAGRPHGDGGPWQPQRPAATAHRLLLGLAVIICAAGAFLFLILPFGVMTGGLGFVMAAALIFCIWYLYQGRREGSWLDRLIRRLQG